MKFLVDANLSPVFAEAVRARFPGSCHVNDVGLTRATGEQIWEYAKAAGLCIATKDGDFHQRSFVRGHPPKVLWIRLGNAATRGTIEAFLANETGIRAFDTDKSASLLVVA